MQKPNQKNTTLRNNQIRDREARIIGSQGQQLGVMTVAAAIQMAQLEGLDLVKIAMTGDMAVCKIMDYGKHKFDQTKKEKESKKQQKQAALKEIQFSMRIDTNDLNIRLRQTIAFIEAGNKVKVMVKMRGREQAFAGKAIELANKFFEGVATIAKRDKEPEKLGRNIIMMLEPITKEKKEKTKGEEK